MATLHSLAAQTLTNALSMAAIMTLQQFVIKPFLTSAFVLALPVSLALPFSIAAILSLAALP